MHVVNLAAIAPQTTNHDVTADTPVTPRASNEAVPWPLSVVSCELVADSTG
jgi:hypothetical protein